MRLKPFDQVMAILLVILVLALAACIGVMCWLPGFEESVIFTVNAYLTSQNWLIKAIITVACLLVIFLCLRVIFIRRKREPRQKVEPAPEGIMLKNGEHGSSFLTLSAVDAMVKKFVRTNSKVRDCKVDVKAVDDAQNIALELKTVLMPDVVIPETCAELQKSLTEHLQNMTGVVVREVKITVEDSTEPATPKQRSVK